MLIANALKSIAFEVPVLTMLVDSGELTVSEEIKSKSDNETFVILLSFGMENITSTSSRVDVITLPLWNLSILLNQKKN